MYWKYGQRVLHAADIVRDDPRLHAVYLSNFSCGPDSFLQSFFKDCLQGKPSLLLELVVAFCLGEVEIQLQNPSSFAPDSSGGIIL